MVHLGELHCKVLSRKRESEQTLLLLLLGSRVEPREFKVPQKEKTSSPQWSVIKSNKISKTKERWGLVSY